MKAMSLSAKKLMAEKFLQKDSFGRVVESPENLFRRIAIKIASAEAQWSSLDDVDYYQYEYFKMMNRLEFLPAVTVLKNISENKPQLIPAFVLSVPDSIEGMTETIKYIREMQTAGVQLGFNFSNLRPQGDPVNSSRELAEGPVKFLQLFNQASLAVHNQEAQRCNLAAMKIDHPDIELFIEEIRASRLDSFQLVVGLSSHFMRCLKKQTTFPLANPRNGNTARFVSAKKLFDDLCQAIHTSENGGILFLDELNRHQPTPSLGRIEATSPYGAEALLENEGSAMGVINLSNMFENNEFNEERFEIVTDLAIRFLDNVLELNYYVSPEIRELTLNNRKLGLSLTGFAELLAKMGIAYDSEKARNFAGFLMKLFLKRSRQASMALAQQRGPFKNYSHSYLAQMNLAPMRNASLITVMPSPTISKVFSTSSGMEALGVDDLLLNSENNFLVSKLKKESLDVNSILQKLKHTEDLDLIKEIPEKIRLAFKLNQKISYRDQIKMQAAFQKYTDNVASRVIQLSKKTTWQDVYQIIMFAYNSKCKGIQLSREGYLMKELKKEKKQSFSQGSLLVPQNGQSARANLFFGRTL